MKYLLIVLGLLSLGLGVLGIVLPILPTTPFLLLSAFLFARSSEKLHTKLLNHKYLGKYIRDFTQDKALPLPVKMGSLLMLWTAILLSVFLAASGKIWLQILLVIIAIGVSIHVLSFRTKR